MNTGHTPPRDELTEQYRRASEAEAGAPSGATRRAILEAARTGMRRQPAANDARYLWSAAASVAILGIALVVLRQVDSTTTSPAAAARNATEVVTARDVLQESAPPEADSAPAKAAAAREAAPRVAEPAVVDADAALLRERFPEVWASSAPPAMVWMVRDSEGRIVREGTLSAGEPLPALPVARTGQSASSRSPATAESALEAAAPAAGNAQFSSGSRGAWSVRTLRNAADVPVRIALAREGNVPDVPAAPAP